MNKQLRSHPVTQFIERICGIVVDEMAAVIVGSAAAYYYYKPTAIVSHAINLIMCPAPYRFMEPDRYENMIRDFMKCIQGKFPGEVTKIKTDNGTWWTISHKEQVPVDIFTYDTHADWVKRGCISNSANRVFSMGPLLVMSESHLRSYYNSPKKTVPDHIKKLFSDHDEKRKREVELLLEY